MRRGLIRGGLLAALLLPGCVTYDSTPRPLYAYHGDPFYAPYHYGPRHYQRAPRSYFSFSFGSGHHRHRHGHHRWHRHRHHHHGRGF